MVLEWETIFEGNLKCSRELLHGPPIHELQPVNCRLS
jgi:hypothetical protein